MNPAAQQATTPNHPVVSRARGVAERVALLEREKEPTRLRDDIARQRRALPWTRIDKDSVFDTPQGSRRLALDLTPKGRDEHNPAYPMDRVRHHDRSEAAPVAQPASESAGGSCCHAKA